MAEETVEIFPENDSTSDAKDHIPHRDIPEEDFNGCTYKPFYGSAFSNCTPIERCVYAAGFGRTLNGKCITRLVMMGSNILKNVKLSPISTLISFYNRCFSEGIFSHIRKEAEMVTILKPGITEVSTKPY